MLPGVIVGHQPVTPVLRRCTERAWVSCHSFFRKFVMNRSSRLGVSVFALGIWVACTPARAQDSHGFMGLALGQAHGEFDAQTLLQRQLPAGSALGAIGHDRSATSFKLFSGYRLNGFWALEGGYFHLGDLGVQGVTSPVGGLSGRIKLQGLNLDLVGFLPLAPSWALTGRVGGVYGYTSIDYQGEGGVVPLQTDVGRSTGSVKFGVGMQYALTDKLTVRFDAQRYRFDDAVQGHGRINVYTLGLQVPTN